MEIVGRITKNAVVNQLKDERKVVNFNLAVNEYYKPKNSVEGKKRSTFINCSYWLNSKIAEWLTKGSLVEITGHISANAYTTSDGNIKAALNCHVNSLKIHSFGKNEGFNKNEKFERVSKNSDDETNEDLPF